MCKFFTHCDIFAKMKTDSSEFNRQSLLLSTLRHVLKPFVRLLLAHGITYTVLLEELKRIFVQVADEEFVINGKRQTDSRITLITGVHRKDVHRIREDKEIEITPKSSLGAQIIAQWTGNPDFLDADGQPKTLSRLQSEGNESSFEALVASVSKDFRARPVYDEWLQSGIISLVEDKKIKLNTETFIQKQDLEEQLFFLRMNIHDHLAATVHNVNGLEEKMMERCVYYNDLTQAQVAQLHTITKQQGMKLLKNINQTAQTLKSQESNNAVDDSQQKYRINSGVYFYFEPTKTSQKE